MEEMNEILLQNDGTQGNNQQKRSNLKDIIKIYKFFPTKFGLFILFILSILNGVMPLTLNIYLGKLTNAASSMDNFLEKVKKICIEMAIIVIATIVSNFLSFGSRSIFSPLFKIAIRKKLFSHFMDQSVTFFDEKTTGILLSRISEDVANLQRVYLEMLADFIMNFSALVAGVVITFVISWKLTLISFTIIPVLIILISLTDKYAGKQWGIYYSEADTASSRAQEVLSQFRTVKSYDCENEEYQSYSSKIRNGEKIHTKASLVIAFKQAFSLFLVYGIIAAIAYFSLITIANQKDNLNVGDFNVVIFILYFVSVGYTQISNYFDEFKKATVSANRVASILEIETNEKRDSEIELGNVEGKIEFKDVSFKYPSKEQLVLKNISFEILPGQTVAFVGESGCGKTTILSLLEKFYDDYNGTILIDGKDLKKISAYDMRSHIAVVPQTPVLFTMSVLDNIRYANTEATQESVEKAATIGNANEFILSLNNQYEEIVQQNSLSGGQKQRICISRAVLKHAPILLLDEATASLDTESEHLVQKSIDTFKKGKTVIIIAHRLSTIVNADKIFVIKDGAIVESGTHTELLEKGGEYLNLVKNQLK